MRLICHAGQLGSAGITFQIARCILGAVHLDRIAHGDEGAEDHCDQQQDTNDIFHIQHSVLPSMAVMFGGFSTWCVPFLYYNTSADGYQVPPQKNFVKNE